jgi:hypothetical protein
MHATDWLEALPQSTLVELMQRRCCLIGGVARGKVTRDTTALFRLTSEEIEQYENDIEV